MVSLSLDPPPSREGRASGGTHRLRVFLVVMAATGLGFAAGRWTSGGKLPLLWPKGAAPAEQPLPAAAASPRPAPGVPPTPAQLAASSPAPASSAPAPVRLAEPAQPLPAGPRRIALVLDGPLEEAITAAVPAADRAFASELTQVVNRLLVWSFQVARDGRRGDRLELLYSPPAGGSEPGAGEPVVQALRYESQKLSTVIAAYRFHAPGARWHRYYRPDGSELEERLVDSPTPEYDQITSLLRDGRRHKGVDFRTPVGSPVFATVDGVIERRNWNFAGNGNCLDVRDLASGRHAILLHLDVLPRDMVPGRRVKKGEQIASSGNSGHSFAPHLHYQLESADGQVLDPFAVLPIRRVALDGAARAAFETERARLDAALTGATVARASSAPAAPPASSGVR
jgi:murein DD-endopeptidase